MSVMLAETYPDHAVIGKYFVAGFDGKHYWCDAYEPALGYWMTCIETPGVYGVRDGELKPGIRTNVSEGAIGATFHQVWFGYAAGETYVYTTRIGWNRRNEFLPQWMAHQAHLRATTPAAASNSFTPARVATKSTHIGGWAPGGYMCKCSQCGYMFTGDKRATSCKPCALRVWRGLVETLYDPERLTRLIRQAARHMNNGPPAGQTEHNASEIAGGIIAALNSPDGAEFKEPRS